MTTNDAPPLAAEEIEERRDQMVHIFYGVLVEENAAEMLEFFDRLVAERDALKAQVECGA